MKQTKEELIDYYKKKIEVQKLRIQSLNDQKEIIKHKIIGAEMGLQHLNQELKNVENNY